MSKKSTRQAYGEALVELGRINNDIVVLDADLSKSTKTDLFKKEFPKRHLNIGIAEADCWFCYLWKNPICIYFRYVCCWKSF